MQNIIILSAILVLTLSILAMIEECKRTRIGLILGIAALLHGELITT